jgi:hypothetical protein
MVEGHGNLKWLRVRRAKLQYSRRISLLQGLLHSEFCI